MDVLLAVTRPRLRDEGAAGLPIMFASEPGVPGSSSLADLHEPGITVLARLDVVFCCEIDRSKRIMCKGQTKALNREL